MIRSLWHLDGMAHGMPMGTKKMPIWKRRDFLGGQSICHRVIDMDLSFANQIFDRFGLTVQLKMVHQDTSDRLNA